MKLLKIFLFCGLSSSAIIATAATPSNLNEKVSSEFNQFQQQNKQQLAQFHQAQQQHWIDSHQYQAPQSQEEAVNLSLRCLSHKPLKFSGFTLIQPEKFALPADWCITGARLNALSRKLTQAYVEQGYIYNPFHFEQDGEGSFIMAVNEGKIGKITSNSDRLNFSTLFPQGVNRFLNIKDLDQVLDQANKMVGSNVTVDLYPLNDGNMELAFSNQEKSRMTGFIGVDNAASRRLQRWQIKSGVNIDSPLGLSDSLYLGVSHTLKSFDQDFNRSATVIYSLPYGYWSFTALGSVSQFKTHTPLQYTTIEQKGKTVQESLRADYTFMRGANYISSISGQLEHINAESYFQGSKLALQSPNLTTAQIGLHHLQVFERGTLSADVSYERGLKWFNALPNQGRDQPEGQFNKYNLDLQFQHYPTLGNQVFHQQHNLMGQYSHNYLPAIKQADFTTRYAVRGFNHLSLSAERSLVLQNNIGWLYYLNGGNLEPYVLFDMGLQKANANDVFVQKALAYGVGLKVNYGKFYVSLELAKGKIHQKEQPKLKERSIFVNSHWLFQ